MEEKAYMLLVGMFCLFCCLARLFYFGTFEAAEAREAERAASSTHAEALLNPLPHAEAVSSSRLPIAHANVV